MLDNNRSIFPAGFPVTRKFPASNPAERKPPEEEQPPEKAVPITTYVPRRSGDTAADKGM